jgi:hypothetical protein
MGQLSYHPQESWAGTQCDAELVQPLTISQGDSPGQMLIQPLENRTPTGTQGSVVDAIMTKPLLDATREEVVLPVCVSPFAESTCQQ